MSERMETMPEFLEQRRERVDAYLAAILPTLGLPENLSEAVSYSLLLGGKRLRPALVLCSCRAAGGDEEAAMPAAAGLEMIHAFSLIHDDLPAMDDDDLRRGQPTSHKRFGEAMAILAGDALATLPYVVIVREVADGAKASRLVGELAEATVRMIVGQVCDTVGGFGEVVSAGERVERIHRDKTGALIRAACRLGGISAGLDEMRLAALTEYGEAVGLMFQVVDDVLDVTQSTEHLGKASNKDAAAGKLTYPGVWGLERSREMVRELGRRARRALSGMGLGGNELRELAEYLEGRTR